MCLYYDSDTWNANHVNSGWWFYWDARMIPYDTHYANGHGAGERRDCTCFSGKHWQLIVTIVDGYIHVIIVCKALVWKTKIIAILSKIDIAQA